uniref:IS3 family transposase n=1 Tax=Vibrio hibernica TaxID=2587465 RepID=UPI001880262A
MKHPECKQERRCKYLFGLIKQFWIESGYVYGYRKIYCDLRDEGETCGINQVHRLMKREGQKGVLSFFKSYKLYCHKSVFRR